GFIVVAATGIVLQDSDAVDTKLREAIYGIWDPTSRIDGTEDAKFEPVKPNQLLEQQEQKLQAKVEDKNYFSISRKRINWQTQRGWKLLLGGWADDGKSMTRAGERVIEQIANFGSGVLISSAVIN